MPQSEVLTLPEVAELLKVHPNTVYRMARRGRIPAFKAGTEWRFLREAIEAWMHGRARAGSRREQSLESPDADLDDEALHVVYWLVSQGLELAIDSSMLVSVLDCAPRAVDESLRRLAERGYIRSHPEAPRRRFTLTPDGEGEARRRFAKPSAPRSGHASMVTFAMRHETATRAKRPVSATEPFSRDHETNT